MLKWLLLGGVAYFGYKMLTGQAAASQAGSQNAAATDISAFVQEAARRLDSALTWTIYTGTNYVGVTGVVGGVPQVKQTFTSLSAAWDWLKTFPVKGTVANVTMAAL